MSEPTEPKKCRVCGEFKPRTEYHRNRAAPDGRRTLCRDCVRAYVDARRARLRAFDPAWEERNRQAGREYQTVWRAEHRERSRRYYRAYYASNRKKILARNRAARQKRAADARAASRDEA